MPSRFVTEVPSHLVEDVGLGSPRRGTGYDTLSADEHLPGATFAPAVSLGRPGRRCGAGAAGGPAGPGAAPGPRTWACRRGDAVVHEHWGRGVVLVTKGEGSRAQATVRLRLGGQEEPPALGHAAAPAGLNLGPRARSGVRARRVRILGAA